jgi:hypothetical protein
MTQTAFGRAMVERGFEKSKGGGKENVIYYKGLLLIELTENEEDDDDQKSTRKIWQDNSRPSEVMIGAQQLVLNVIGRRPVPAETILRAGKEHHYDDRLILAAAERLGITRRMIDGIEHWENPR